MQLTLTGYSTALFSTWFFVEELGLLFDAGDGVAAGLLQKSRKIKYVFISHADRDHLTGLLQLNQLNAQKGFPIIYYPKDCGSFPHLEAFSKKFDPHVSGTIWQPIEEGMEFEIKKGIFVRAIRNSHVLAEKGISKSLSFKVFEKKTKLKPEFLQYSGKEIQQLMKTKGKATLTEEIESNLISYSGDTPVEDYETWNGSKILIHEATFLGGEENIKHKPHGNQHSTLEEVMEMVSNIDIGSLVLSHFSSRYSPTEIDNRIKSLCEKYGIDIPVYRVLPGEILRGILKGKTIKQT